MKRNQISALVSSTERAASTAHAIYLPPVYQLYRQSHTQLVIPPPVINQGDSNGDLPCTGLHCSTTTSKTQQGKSNQSNPQNYNGNTTKKALHTLFENTKGGAGAGLIRSTS
jgi:hypothetical protein